MTTITYRGQTRRKHKPRVLKMTTASGFTSYLGLTENWSPVNAFVFDNLHEAGIVATRLLVELRQRLSPNDMTMRAFNIVELDAVCI